MEYIDINISKILTAFNMDVDAEFASELANLECVSDDNLIEILNGINGVGYEIEENVYSLPSMSVGALYERKNQIIMRHHELARRYFDSLTFSKRLQTKLALLRHSFGELHTKYYSTKVL